MHPYANTNATSRAQQAAQALTYALTKPYQHSSHYAQAYYGQQASSSTSLKTSEGYSFSSAYLPSAPTQAQKSSVVGHSVRGAPGSNHSRGGGNKFHSQRGQIQPTHWYEPGDNRCTYGQCCFTGSRKTVEIHMMDRHLIYPPGWNKHKRKNEWDADPSLKNGKPIPIQGTGIVLDTPEAVDAWIAERRKRWPTTSRVDEKQTKLIDALERGEITASDSGLLGRKRPRTDDQRGQTRGRGRGRGGTHGSAQAPRIRVVHPLPIKPVTAVAEKSNDLDDETSSSGSDMDPEKDAISSKPPHGIVEVILEKESAPETKVEVEASKEALIQPVTPLSRKAMPRPKAPLNQKNPFAKRESLLRNLLLPEIRTTVSNLSQAIHFLVENDFLQDVELNPGDADNKLIEVISETSHETV